MQHHWLATPHVFGTLWHPFEKIPLPFLNYTTTSFYWHTTSKQQPLPFEETTYPSPLTVSVYLCGENENQNPPPSPITTPYPFPQLFRLFSCPGCNWGGYPQVFRRFSCPGCKWGGCPQVFRRFSCPGCNWGGCPQVFRRFSCPCCNWGGCPQVFRLFSTSFSTTKLDLSSLLENNGPGNIFWLREHLIPWKEETLPVLTE